MQHHSVICKYCGKTFFSPARLNRKYCSSDCYHFFTKAYGQTKKEIDEIIHCKKCGKEIPKAFNEQDGKCFKCFCDDRKILTRI